MEALEATTTSGKKTTLNKASVQQRRQFFHSTLGMLTALVLLGTLLLVSCESDVPEEQCPPVQHVEEFRSPESVTGLRNARSQILPFTGRDSFGIVLDAAVVGDLERVSAGGDSSLVEFTGTGQSALLGEIDITQVHYVDLSSNEIRGGRFTFQSESGEVVSGTYEGSRTPAGDGFTLQGRAKITGGEVGCTPTNLESGWGWINGSLADNRWDYNLEGWLFHHAEVNE